MAQSHQRIELTPRGQVVAILAVGATLAAWLSGAADVRMAAALLAAPMLVEIALCQRRLRRVELRIKPRMTTTGARFLERIELAADSTLRDVLVFEPRTMRTEPPLFVPQLAGSAPAAFSLMQRSTVRSHALQRVFVLTSTWPLGLLRVRRALAVDADLITAPAPVRLGTDLTLAMCESPHTQPSSRGSGDEFHSLRDHTPGEDAHLVHALRSAASGMLVRRVLRSSTPREAGIVLDLRQPPSQRQLQGGRRFEWCLGACTTLLEQLRQQGIAVRCLVIDSETVVLPMRTAHDFAALHTLLAEANLADYRPLPLHALASLDGVEHCYWIPAGGHREAAQQAQQTLHVTLLDREDP